MNREEIQKLLGGYGTGTLTPEERQALFAAALEDQELFDALGREQALRDLLRDPAAKAELLAALDAPAVLQARFRGGWMAWLRRPLVAGLATAMAAISLLVVWRGTRAGPVASTRATHAEMSQAKMKAPEVRMPEPVPAVAPEGKVKQQAEIPSPRDARAAKSRERAGQESAGQGGGMLGSGSVRQESAVKDRVSEVKAPLPAAPPAPPPAAATAPPIPPVSMAEAVEVTAAAQAVQAATPSQNFQAGGMQDKLTQDARTLFYGNAFVRRDSALTAPLAGVTAGAQPSTPKVANASVLAGTGNFAKQQGPATLGVRVSLLRGDEEVAVATVLNSGESVRLKVTPNEDGFLYVAARDGTVWRMVASGPAQRLKPFETPPLRFTGSGQKLLYVMLSRQAQMLSPQSLAGLARTNMVETLAEQDRATYVVAGLQDGAPQQVVQPITVTYR